MTEPRLMLLDSASLYFRAFFGVPDDRADDSITPTNAVRGFLDFIATLVRDHQPTRLIACWDNDWRPQFRVDAIPSYKSHRVADAGTVEEEVPDALSVQVPIIEEALAALGIARLGADGFEADDVIGTLVARHKGALPIDVVTGDRDLFQLVDDAASVRVLYTARGGVRNPDLVDQAFLAEKYGVATGDQYADMAALRGDTSDGLPGVAGVGEKTAAKLITAYGSLVALRAAIDGGDPAIKGAQRRNLEAGAAYLDVAPLVVRVALDAPVADVDGALPAHIADLSAMSRLASTYGLTSPMNRVIDALGLGGD
ncbi:5'-3' exonuclease [Nostocoides sp.]|uniref:5'-3' exonuclease n=1 Tax=Nostocoides sp. TaxID=1917966 RepID=UPI002CEDDD62|nr:5'-3' exonuclease [Tetrasphaera sp.]